MAFSLWARRTDKRMRMKTSRWATVTDRPSDNWPCRCPTAGNDPALRNSFRSNWSMKGRSTRKRPVCDCCCCCRCRCCFQLWLHRRVPSPPATGWAEIAEFPTDCTAILSMFWKRNADGGGAGAWGIAIATIPDWSSMMLLRPADCCRRSIRPNGSTNRRGGRDVAFRWFRSELVARYSGTCHHHHHYSSKFNSVLMCVTNHQKKNSQMIYHSGTLSFCRERWMRSSCSDIWRSPDFFNSFSGICLNKNKKQSKKN